MDALRKQASKLREQVAKQQQVNNDSIYLSNLPFFFFHSLIFSILVYNILVSDCLFTEKMCKSKGLKHLLDLFCFFYHLGFSKRLK